MTYAYSIVTDKRYPAVQKDGRWMPEAKALLKEAESPRYDVAYRTLYAEGGHAAVVVTLRDKAKDISLSQVCETTEADPKSLFITHLCEHGLYVALCRMLKMEIVREEQEEGLDDDTVLLLGSLKGKRYGDVKGTEELSAFLSKLSLLREPMRYPDEERQKQMEFLLKLAKGANR